MKKAAEYAELIMRDERDEIVTETPTVYTAARIERVYTFADGAVVRYEWQSAEESIASGESYNHRFTLDQPPSPNPHRLKTGIIETIEF